jgi:hypothetical protein
MNQERLIILCEICGAEVCGEGSVCQDCQLSFEPGSEEEKTGPSAPLNLEKYGGRMFPWEQMLTQPRLITIHFAWLVLAIGLIVLVFLLALLRTPLPSCWEISS